MILMTFRQIDEAVQTPHSFPSLLASRIMDFMTDPTRFAQIIPRAPSGQEIVGGCILATAISFILYGITLTQTFIYMLNFPNDSVHLKGLIGVLWYSATTCDAAYSD
ncbi:hypothetical protein K474DRAFT_1221718 [Panus rudis PR-1116 ss-1]|nr:hypothetical protein K474DRAFT_1221718 [Panus rudis PR-1116 ss-1]